jgi:hypothetical protein
MTTTTQRPAEGTGAGEATAADLDAVAPGALNREQLIDLLREMKDVGSVELKVSVPAHKREAMRGLGIDTLQGKIREVYFFDTPELTLFKAGVVPRARRTQGAVDDTVVKLRPCAPQDLPAKVRKSPNLKVEMDITRGAYVVSASLKGQRKVGMVAEAVSGKRPLEKLFTKEQRAFYADHAPAGVSWSDLVPLGPAYIVLLKYTPPDLGRRLTIEQWHYPGEVPLVELSTKTAPKDVLAVVTDAVTFLGAHGLTAEGEQEPKTRKALEYFSALA